MKIIEQLVSRNIVEIRSYGYGNTCDYITIHETGNTKKGANAKMHANLQTNKNSREASWHYQVDDTNIIQSFDDTVKCWHGGDGLKGVGNNRSIAIEMCVNSDGDFNKTIQNTVLLVKHLMKKHKIPFVNVVQHNKWSGKNCPMNLRSGKPISWDGFKNMIIFEEKDDTLYQVVTGTFKEYANAENMSADLKRKGIPNYIYKK